jgi:hypothetical protein
MSVRLGDIDLNLSQLTLDMSRGDVQIILILTNATECLCNFIMPGATENKKLADNSTYTVTNMMLAQNIIEYSYKNLEMAK